MLKSCQFITVYIMAFCSIFLGFFAVNSFKNFGELNGISDGFLSIIGSVGSLFNFIQFLWSWLSDKYPFKYVYGLLLIFQIIFGLLLVFFEKNKWVYGFSYCMLMFCEGGHFTLVPNVLRFIFGDRATVLYGIMFSYTGICSVVTIGL